VKLVETRYEELRQAEEERAAALKAQEEHAKKLQEDDERETVCVCHLFSSFRD
jgi:hypothetical protein